MRFVITGANRGLGLEFTRQLVERGDGIRALFGREEFEASATPCLILMVDVLIVSEIADHEQGAQRAPVNGSLLIKDVGDDQLGGGHDLQYHQQ